MGAFKYIASVTVCAVLYIGFFILLDTSLAFRTNFTGLQKMVLAALVGAIPAASLAGAFTKEFELERFVGRVAIIASLGAFIGWLGARGIMTIATLL